MKLWTDGRQTDDGARVSYKLTYERSAQVSLKTIVGSGPPKVDINNAKQDLNEKQYVPLLFGAWNKPKWSGLGNTESLNVCSMVYLFFRCAFDCFSVHHSGNSLAISK